MMGTSEIEGAEELGLVAARREEPEKLSVKTENELREVEKKLEDIGRRICSVNGSCVTHGRINLALDEIREAIHNCYLMDAEDAE